MITFHRNAFYGPEINGNPIVYIADLTFEIRARAVHHVIVEHTRELPLEQKLTFNKWSIPLKDIPTCLITDIYHMCRTRHFCWKGQCATEIQLLDTPHDRRYFHGRQAMAPLWCSSSNTLCFPQKNWYVDFRDRGWGQQRYLPPRLRGHGNADGDCSNGWSCKVILQMSHMVERWIKMSGISTYWCMCMYKHMYDPVRCFNAPWSSESIWRHRTW